MSSIARSVQEIKADLRSIIEPSLIFRLCAGAGHAWRDRTLGPVDTIYLFLAQVLHGNTSCAHVRQFGNFTFTRSAYCEARKRLPVEVFRSLLRETGQRVSKEASRVGLWLGHRVVSVDGSTFSMSDTNELRALFHWASRKRGFEFTVSKFVALFDLIIGALRLEVELVSHQPQEFERVAVFGHLGVGQQSEVEEVVQVAHGRLRATRHPIGHVIVTQATGALLQVRLQEEQALSVLAVAGDHRLQLFADEALDVGKQLGSNRVRKFVEEFAIAAQEASRQHRSANGHVFASQLDGVPDGPSRAAYR